MARLLNPSTWVSFAPNGLGHVKPNHIAEMLQVAWANRDQLPYAMRILNDGVCDGCALGTTGMRDFTMDGIHLCTVRLNLLRLNTMGAMDSGLLADVDALRRLNSKQLRDLGRLPYPMLRQRGEAGFRRVGWDEALDVAAARIRATTPQRHAYYLTARGITNEVYYAAQKAVRYMGTNHIDNASRICHAPSTSGLKHALGVAASTCSYKDWIGTDLLVFIGTDAPNNQPVTTKYMYLAKQAGTRILVINPYREPGLERYWVPSVFESLLFGTRLADRFFQIHTGGDLAFLTGVLKAMIEHGWQDNGFISGRTAGWDETVKAVEAQSWETLERFAGTTRDEMEALARLLGEAKSAVFVWSMGITQHVYGVENVKAICNLALARGFVGRDHCGLMPIRGHSGVQGSAEMGAVPWNFAFGAPMDEREAARLRDLWGFEVPTWKGYSAVEMLQAAGRGDLDVLWSMGGNFLETLPDPEAVEKALGNVPLRVHQDIVVTSQMLVEPKDAVLLLPAQTRYEQPGGGTETSTERRVYFSPEIPGPRIAEARSEWQVFVDLAGRVRPESRQHIEFKDAQAIRDDIARTIPAYDGIQHLKKKGDAFQWGGPHLCADSIPTADGKAHFAPLEPHDATIPDGWFRVSTRRGKQFNSMIQKARDPLTGALRDDVFMSGEDAGRLGLGEGDRIELTSETGRYQGRVKIAAIKPLNLQVHWPEGNVLLKTDRYDPVCHIPDYNALVQVHRVSGG